jgi:hypothetical protein
MALDEPAVSDMLRGCDEIVGGISVIESSQGLLRNACLRHRAGTFCRRLVRAEARVAMERRVEPNVKLWNRHVINLVEKPSLRRRKRENKIRALRCFSDALMAK